MINQILEKKRKIISDFTFYYDENSKLPQWQMDRLDEIDEKIKKGEIKSIDSDESDRRIMAYINNLYSEK